MENLQQEIDNSVNILKQGKVILYPTDTIWGIGADATNSKAVQRIYKIKERDAGKSMIILLDSMEKLSDYVEDVPEISYDLIEKTRVPLTIVYPKAKNLAKNLVAADGSIAIRVVKGAYCSEVIRKFGKPIVSTSANMSGDKPPKTFNDISQMVIDRVDYVVNVFRNRINTVKPSTIIKMGDDGMFEIIRS
jgi:L-threonylcarbamoyladenylate synthase